MSVIELFEGYFTDPNVTRDVLGLSGAQGEEEEQTGVAHGPLLTPYTIYPLGGGRGAVLTAVSTVHDGTSSETLAITIDEVKRGVKEIKNRILGGGVQSEEEMNVVRVGRDPNASQRWGGELGEFFELAYYKGKGGGGGGDNYNGNYNNNNNNNYNNYNNNNNNNYNNNNNNGNNSR